MSERDARLSILRDTLARIIVKETEIAVHLGELRADADQVPASFSAIDRYEATRLTYAMATSDHLAELIARVSEYLETLD